MRRGQYFSVYSFASRVQRSSKLSKLHEQIKAVKLTVVINLIIFINVFLSCEYTLFFVILQMYKMRKMKDKEERIARAVAYFKAGYNCSQSVVAAFADLYGFTEEQAFHMAASFGGGIGRMRLTCGAACGMFMLAGLDFCAIEGQDRVSKSKNYAIVQNLAEQFKAINGSITCSELLKLRAGTPVVSEAEQRTPEYYAKRPCVKMVETAATLFAEYLESKE